MLENYSLNNNNIYLPKINKNMGFNYTDGDDIEKYLINVLKNSNDLSSNSIELTRKGRDWPSLYHLSARRSNIFRPFLNILKRKNILEVGAGCGALSRILGENASKLISVEGNINRAYINSLRTQELDSVSIICDNYQNYLTSQKFDIITLVGVLEYSRIYFKKSNNDSTFSQEELLLQKIYSELDDNGMLFLAIENKLGLKYFAGYPEDHLGISMAGIEGLYGENSPVTFGKLEIELLLKKCGFSNIMFYYPFPDYKMPTTIFCHDLINNYDKLDLSYILESSEKMDPQRPKFTTFNMNLVWREVYKNKLWQDLSNSFLIIASKNLIKEENLCYHYSIDRNKEYQKEILFSKNSTVIKKFLNYKEDYNEKLIPFSFNLELANEQFGFGINWESEIIKIVNLPNWKLENINLWLNKWINCLKDYINFKGDKISLNHELDGKLIDAIPRNLIVLNNNYKFFDLEWSYKGKINFQFLLLRSLFSTILEQEYLAYSPVLPLVEYNRWNLIKKVLINEGYWLTDSDYLNFLDKENEFQNIISSNYKKINIANDQINSIFLTRTNFQVIQEKEKTIQELLKLYKNSLSYKIGFTILNPMKAIFKIIRKIKNKILPIK